MSSLEDFPKFSLPEQYMSEVVFHASGTHVPWYTFKRPLEAPFYAGYYIIPGYSRYAINVEGVVLNRRTGRILTPTYTKSIPKKNITGGYAVFGSMVADLGQVSGGRRHRLLMLTFGECPGHPDNHWVNHIDGVPGNDDLANLEWVTPSQNVLHAYRNGLHPDKVRALDAWNYLTGEQRSFQSVALAVEYTGLNHSLITSRLNVPAQNGRLHLDGWRFKDVDESWRELHSHANKTANESAVLVKQVATGEITRYPSYRACAAALGIKWATIQMHCLRGTQKPFRGYQFRKDGVDVQWPEVNPDYTGGRSMYVHRITDVNTGKVLWSGSVDTLVKATGLHPLLVSRSCASGKVRGDWKFSRALVVS